jgi:hypothetical protein
MASLQLHLQDQKKLNQPHTQNKGPEAFPQPGQDMPAMFLVAPESEEGKDHHKRKDETKERNTKEKEQTASYEEI